MSLFDDMKTWLKTQSTVTDLVGATTAARIFPEDLKQNTTLPAIVLTQFAGESYAHLKGRPRIGRTRVQFDVYAATTTAAAALDKIVDDLLRPDAGDTRTTFNSRTIHCVEAEGTTRSGVTDPIKGGSTYRFWTSRDYMITHAE